MRTRTNLSNFTWAPAPAVVCTSVSLQFEQREYSNVLSEAFLLLISGVGGRHVVGMSSAVTTRADLVIVSGNIPQTDENVLLNTGQ